MLFSWQFILIGFPNKAMFIFAKDYNSAISKIKKIGEQIKGFNVRNWEIEEIIEIEDFDEDE